MQGRLAAAKTIHSMRNGAKAASSQGEEAATAATTAGSEITVKRKEEEVRAPAKENKVEEEADDSEDSDEEAFLVEEEEDTGKKPEVQVWEWLDDLLEGTAFLYTLVVYTLHSFTDWVRRVAYPIKEQVIQSYDEGMNLVYDNGSPTRRRRKGGHTSTFAYDELESDPHKYF